MLNPAADANSSARAPNCTVFDVSAKYASHLNRGLSPDDRLIAIRSSFGNPGGGLNAGCSPPTDNAKFGDPDHFSLIAISPVSVNFFSSLESCSAASKDAVP